MTSACDRSASGTMGVDSSAVELSAGLQAEIRDFAKALPNMDLYAVLGVERGADDAAIRDGFFQRSRRFHPDRYFHKNLGPYGPLITEIYKRIVAAYEVLRDPKLRVGYDRTFGTSSTPRHIVSPSASAPGTAGDPSVGTGSAPEARLGDADTPATPMGPSLRARKGFPSKGPLGGLEAQLKHSRAKAQKHQREASEYRERGDWVRAAQALRLALAFDPRDSRLHDALADVLPKANEIRAGDLLRNAEALLARGDRQGACPPMIEASQLFPMNAELAFRVAELLFDLETDLELAVEFGERAVALDGDAVRYRKALGKIYASIGDRPRARKHLQRAWEIDPMDKETKALLRVC